MTTTGKLAQEAARLLARTERGTDCGVAFADGGYALASLVDLPGGALY
ncbi:hypothetical protein [Streptomyces sp. NPDC004728]